MAFILGLAVGLFGCAAVQGERTGAAAAAVAACTGCEPFETTGSVVLRGGTVVGLGRADVVIQDGRITDVSLGAAAEGIEVVDVTGRYLVPGFIDSHVHLAYLPESAALLDRGVVGVVDLAAPLSFLAEDLAPMQVIASGPMVTAVGGYPTQSWGRNGYGAESSDANSAEDTVDMVISAGARVVKLPVTPDPQLSPAALLAATARAHDRGVKVVSHALSDAEASTAAVAGVDALAHTPTESLSPATLTLWSDRVVISTLAAFGGSDSTVANLAALHAAGTTVLYGTDFGNRNEVGIDPDEVALLQAAGLSAAQILASATAVPAAYFGFEGLGEIAVGARGSVVVLSRDPLVDIRVLAEPESVYVDGVRRGSTE